MGIPDLEERKIRVNRLANPAEWNSNVYEYDIDTHITTNISVSQKPSSYNKTFNKN
jgi:hypothetical protein